MKRNQEHLDEKKDNQTTIFEQQRKKQPTKIKKRTKIIFFYLTLLFSFKTNKQSLKQKRLFNYTKKKIKTHNSNNNNK